VHVVKGKHAVPKRDLALLVPGLPHGYNGSQMQPQEVKTLALTLGAAVFRQRFAGFHLAIALGEVPVELGFRTVVASSHVPATDALSEVVTIAKALGNPYPDRVSVGRARNCDIVARHPSVSKLHACFSMRDDRPVALLDLGSNNGTLLNGRRLTPQVAEPIQVGDMVHFGRVAATIVDATALRSLLCEL